MSTRVPWILAGAAGAVLAFGAFMIWRAESKTNKDALSDAPKRVTAIEGRAARRASSTQKKGSAGASSSQSAVERLPVALTLVGDERHLYDTDQKIRSGSL